MNSLSNYIIRDLKLKANNWVATVHKIDMDGLIDKRIDVELLIPIEEVPEDKHPQYSSIVLTANISYKSKRLVDVLRNLKKNDKVLVSGKFLKVPDGTIFITSYGVGYSEDFANPQLTFELTDIVKK